MKIKIHNLLIPSLLFFVAHFVSAASFDASSPAMIEKGAEFVSHISLRTESAEINALEGVVLYPRTILRLKEIRDGNSIVTFWVENPKESASGEIRFSGVIPGGYQGERGALFSLVFEGKDEGNGLITFSAGRVLLNDGEGTSASFLKTNTAITVIKGKEHEMKVAPITDNELPETFIPEIGRDSALYNGQWFVVFATQDKKSGIDHFEVRESRWPFSGSFVRAESPYILKDQSLQSFLSIKAVDRSGNERIAEVSPKNLPWYENYKILSILIVVAFALLFPFFRRRK